LIEAAIRLESGMILIPKVKSLSIGELAEYTVGVEALMKSIKAPMAIKADDLKIRQGFMPQCLIGNMVKLQSLFPPALFTFWRAASNENPQTLSKS